MAGKIWLPLVNGEGFRVRQKGQFESGSNIQRHWANLTAIPGLSLKPQTERKSKDYLKSLQNLLDGSLSKKRNLVIWHDLINNTLSGHPIKEIPAETPQSLVETLRSIKHKVSAIVYCQRLGTPDVYLELKTSGIPVISVRKNLLSKRKQSNIILNIKYSALHQESNLELKSLIIVLKHADNLKLLTANTRTKKTRLSQKKRRANQRARAE